MLNTFRVNEVKTEPPFFYVTSLTCLVVKKSEAMCTCLVNVCLQRNADIFFFKSRIRTCRASPLHRLTDGCVRARSGETRLRMRPEGNTPEADVWKRQLAVLLFLYFYVFILFYFLLYFTLLLLSLLLSFLLLLLLLY